MNSDFLGLICFLFLIERLVDLLGGLVLLSGLILACQLIVGFGVFESCDCFEAWVEKCCRACLMGHIYNISCILFI